jgi:hypothetical protein
MLTIHINFFDDPIFTLLVYDFVIILVGIAKRRPKRNQIFWIKDKTIPIFDIKNVQIYRFCRVPFGIISSPFLLAAMIDLHLQKYRNPVAEKIRDNIYVDKLLTGADTKDKLKELYHESKDIF